MAKIYLVGAVLAGTVLLTAYPNVAFAWGPEGHALIGEIADQLLAGTPAGKKVDQILGSYTLEDAAKWPDCVRSVHKEADGSFRFVPDKYTGSCTAFETPDEEKRMEDYAARNWDEFPFRPGHGDHEAFHFADIPIEDGKYTDTEIGASDHDVVHAINAAIDKLKGEPVPAPFSIKDDKEAILMLAHFVGDLHQPLHVGTAYLSANCAKINPQSETEAAEESTEGGNLIRVGKTKELHGEWDAITPSLQKDVLQLFANARQVPIDKGPIERWATAWASESVVDATAAFDGVSFIPTGPQKWWAQFVDRTDYLKMERWVQRKRIIQAGARLAEIFKAIWPN